MLLLLHLVGCLYNFISLYLLRLAKQSQFIPLQNVVYFITWPVMVRKIFTFYTNYVLIFKCPIPGPRVNLGCSIFGVCSCDDAWTQGQIQELELTHVRSTWLSIFSHFCHRYPTFRNVTSLCRQTKYKYYEIYDIFHVIWGHFYVVTTRWLRTVWRIAQNLPRRSKLSKHHKYHHRGINVTSYKPMEDYGLSSNDSHKIRQWSAGLSADTLYRIPDKSENACRKYGWKYLHIQSKDFHCTDFHEIHNGINHF